MYELLLERQAERDLKKLPAEIFHRVIHELKGLAQIPRPPGCRKLTGFEDNYRIRVGDYRVLYEIDDKSCQLRILKIGHRKDVYR